MIGDFRIGIMGTGNIAEKMAKTIKSTKGVINYAVGSRDLQRAQEFAKTNGVKKAYGSYEELVNDPKVSLIYVATPHSEHFDNVKLAISAGKAVLCEKAFMLNEKQATQI
ncbi:MAG: Gfo/Idh/MocA family oxidoreductase, partial [Butyrivibrio sp.]|nr:Gfo/Idh/MocA family oxidoreductase [Butyrivibrio sp.]